MIFSDNLKKLEAKYDYIKNKFAKYWKLLSKTLQKLSTLDVSKTTSNLQYLIWLITNSDLWKRLASFTFFLLLLISILIIWNYLYYL